MVKYNLVPQGDKDSVAMRFGQTRTVQDLH